MVLRYSGDGTDYAEFLKTSPVITSCIVDLTVEFQTNRNSDTSREAEAKWMSETLIPIFSTLGILRQLLFVGADFREDAFLAKICSSLSTASVVQLSMCHFSKFSRFVELVWSCPSLENLRIDTISFDQVDAYTPRPPDVPRPELKFLMIIYYSSVHMPVVIDWLVSEGFCTHVDFLVVFQQHIECPAITRLLPAVGSNLRHLSVSYAFLPTVPDSKDGKSVVSPFSRGTRRVRSMQETPFYWSAPFISPSAVETPTFQSLHFTSRIERPYLPTFILPKADSADLFPTIAHCTDLRTLNFIFAGIATFAWIPLVISQISSPHVEEIDLGIADIFAPDDFDRFDWPSLWSALTQPRFVKLKSVRFMVAAESCQSSKKMKDCITRHLKKIDTRGLIHVECPI